jgi:hypothetical protein
MDVTIAASGPQQDDKAEGIEAASFDYVRGPYKHEQATVFEGQNNLGEFNWKSELGSISGRSGTEIVLDKKGVMAVRQFGRSFDFAPYSTQSTHNKRIEESGYRISPAAIPTIFDSLAFSQIIESDHEEIFVDILNADGTILPLLIRRIDRERTAIERLFEKEAARKEVAHIFRAEFMDGRDFYDEVFLDEGGRILKRLLKREAECALERTDAETLQSEFPERGDYILQRDKLPR